MVHTLSSPLRVAVTKNKDFILNLNNYRNAHYQTLNRAKIKYKEVMKSQIEDLPPMERVKVTITLYPGTARKCDLSNVCSIHDKFFMDALVELGKLPDDDYTHTPEVSYRYGCIDRVNPRCSIEIQEIDEK